MKLGKFLDDENFCREGNSAKAKKVYV